MVKVAVVLPAELLAVTVYVVIGLAAEGVPLITPVALSARVTGAPLSLSFAGRTGRMLYAVGAPPVLVGAIYGMDTPTVKTTLLGL
jgi:hypothetical protein